MLKLSSHLSGSAVIFIDFHNSHRFTVASLQPDPHLLPNLDGFLRAELVKATVESFLTRLVSKLTAGDSNSLRKASEPIPASHWIDRYQRKRKEWKHSLYSRRHGYITCLPVEPDLIATV